jgi:LAO/AO transport system kinase
MKANVADLVSGMLAGSQSSLAKLITLMESYSSDVPKIMEMISPHLEKAYCVGITGAAGVGKSTLASALATTARDKGLSVGIVAADPSSALHGGAVLGDRVRMQQHFLDSQVFIRSMATHGSQGGLPRCIGNVTKLLDAFGKDIIIVETIGVGQTETNITEVADTIVLVLSPEFGDSIQFMKAGLIEIADVIVVNKADHGYAENLVSELKTLLSLSPNSAKHGTAVLTTQAINNVGIEELYQELENRRRILKAARQPH